MLLKGTDGSQFSPELSEDDQVSVFVNDLSRNCNFDYSHKDDTYSHVDTMVYKMDLANPANENYSITIDGTTNMTTTFNA